MIGENQKYAAAQSHASKHKVNADPNPSGKAEPGRFSFGVLVCGTGWLQSGRGMARIRSRRVS